MSTPPMLTTAILLLWAVFSACENAPAESAARRAPDTYQAEQAATGPVAELADGAALYKKYCVLCHGADGKLGLNGAKQLPESQLSLEERVAIITKGKGVMTPFGEILSPAEIRSVAEFTLSFKNQ